MRTILLISLALVLVNATTIAQDTLYIYKSGSVVGKHAVADIDSMTFSTAVATTVTDIDNNVYNIITIGGQVWMKENLKTTKYNDNTSIDCPGTDNTAWLNNTTGAYAWYDNNEATYKNVYGALYNWNAVNTGKLCPTGWHVPTDAEWTTLTSYLGGESVAGGKLKETSTTHWYPNTDATNEYGFTALPGGERFTSSYEFITEQGYWWTATENLSNTAYYRNMFNNYGTVYRADIDRKFGFSVRCLKN